MNKTTNNNLGKKRIHLVNGKEVEALPKLETKEVLTFNGKQILGNPELLKEAVMFIAVGWEGRANKIINCNFEKLHTSWLESCDKGGLGAFGVNAKGEVVFGVVYYEEEGLLVVPKNSCDPWYELDKKTGQYR